MSFSPDDPVLACVQTVNDCAVGQTSSSERVYRYNVQEAGKWQAGDTIKVHDDTSTFRFFGYNDIHLTTKMVLQKENGEEVGITQSGTGSYEVTVTLTEGAPDGETLTIGYRVGIECTYVELLQDRKDDDLDVHSVTLDGDPIDYVDVYNKPHRFLGTNAKVKGWNYVAGISLQSNPPE